jgi:uncharacterized protein (TIGR02001 family)
MKKTLVALSLAAMTLPALAQDKKAPEPDYTITGNVGITSDYRFRGISQSNLQPAVQAGLDFAHKSGVYLGNWNSSVSTWTAPTGAGVEMDLYGGYKTELAGIGLDMGAIYYFYPGAKINNNNPDGPIAGDKNTFNTGELYVGVSYGPLSFKTSYTVTKQYFGLGKDYALEYGLDGLSDTKDVKGTLYYDLGFAYEIAPKVTLKIHAGYLNLKNATNWKIKDYSLGLAYALKDDVTLTISGYKTSLGSNAKSSAWFETASDESWNKKLYRNGAGISLTKTF